VYNNGEAQLKGKIENWALDTGKLNLAESLSEDFLRYMGAEIVRGYNDDEATRSDWVERYKKATELATQIAKKKTFPWDGASNVQYPLVSIAGLQFHARAYPMLLPTNKLIITTQLYGFDPDEMYARASQRIRMYMSWQIFEEMDTWEEDFDRMLITLSITGSEFKKTYFSELNKRVESSWVPARDLVVNYWTTDLESCRRVTHVQELYKNEILDLQEEGVFLDCDLPDPQGRNDKLQKLRDKTQGMTVPSMDPRAEPYMILEQHCWWDLDGDGYEEPYVVTVLEQDGKVLRVVPRFYKDDVTRKTANAQPRIKARNYFTHYIFIPSPDGGFYGMGLGLLLGPLNHSVNTLVNQLVDAGSLNNLQSGFLSDHLRLETGEMRFKLGEWKYVNALSGGLKESILPLPSKEPSTVLFSLLNLLISAGQQLASTTDIMVGENPGQNQKATTSQIVLEQGMKVYTAIYKRVRSCMGKEFKRIAELNALHYDVQKYVQILNPEQIHMQDLQSQEVNDFELSRLKIVPSADPYAVSSSQRLQQAQMLMEMAAQGLVNPQVALEELLAAMEVPEARRQQLLAVPERQPSIEEQVKLREVALQEKEFVWTVNKESAELELEAAKVDIQAEDSQTKRIAAVAKAMTDSMTAEIKDKDAETKKKAGATKSK
jgi:chaperonin GroES